MPRTLGYFKYKTRSSIEIYGSGSFSGTSDTGYVYGWSEALTEFELRGYLKTFAGSTSNAKAGMMLRTQANSNVAYIGIMVLGDNTIKVYERDTTNSITDTVASATLSAHQALWLRITRSGTTLTFQYSTDLETTAPGSITWTTLHTATGIVDAWSSLEKHLCCSSGTDNVNLAYFTEVYTQDCWISPIGQKED